MGRNFREEGSVAWLSSCSRNAHDKAVLLRRAQSRINQATLPQRNLASRPGGGESTSELGGSIYIRGTTLAWSIAPGARALRRASLDGRSWTNGVSSTLEETSKI